MFIELPQLRSALFTVTVCALYSVPSHPPWGRVWVKTKVTISFISNFGDSHSLAAKNANARELWSSKLIIAAPPPQACFLQQFLTF